MLLGDREVPVAGMHVTLTYPAAWGTAAAGRSPSPPNGLDFDGTAGAGANRRRSALVGRVSGCEPSWQELLQQLTRGRLGAKRKCAATADGRRRELDWHYAVQPVGRFAVSDVRDAVECVVFVAVALVTSALADLARTLSAEAEESDFTAEMARLMLNADGTAGGAGGETGCAAGSSCWRHGCTATASPPTSRPQRCSSGHRGTPLVGRDGVAQRRASPYLAARVSAACSGRRWRCAAVLLRQPGSLLAKYHDDEYGDGHWIR